MAGDDEYYVVVVVVLVLVGNLGFASCVVCVNVSFCDGW